MANEWFDVIANPGSIFGGMGGQAPSSEGGLEPNLEKVAEQMVRDGFADNMQQARTLVKTMGAPEQQDAADGVNDILTQAAIEVSGLDLFQYRGGNQRLPHWVPKGLRDLATQQPKQLTGVYDPYYGMLDSQGDERVYMGTEKVRRKKPDTDVKPGLEGKLFGDSYETPTKEVGKPRKRDKVMSLQKAKNMPYTWDDEEIADAMRRFREAGWNVATFDDLVGTPNAPGAWEQLVDRASKTYTMSQGDRKVTPWDVLEMTKREAQASGNFTNFESGTQTQTATSVAEISEGAAWRTLQSTLSSLLGRDPSDRELRDYAYRMNSLAAQNPSVTETATRYEAGRPVSQESTTTGGFDASDMAQEAYEDAQNDPEYAKYQAGSTYYNALISAVGAIGDV